MRFYTQPSDICGLLSWVSFTLKTRKKPSPNNDHVAIPLRSVLLSSKRFFCLVCGKKPDSLGAAASYHLNYSLFYQIQPILAYIASQYSHHFLDVSSFSC